MSIHLFTRTCVACGKPHSRARHALCAPCDPAVVIFLARQVRAAERQARPLTVERLKELLEYDPLTGRFRWTEAHPTRAGKFVGAGSPGKRGQIHIDGRRYLTARLAWLYMTGKWPAGQIDHWDVDCINDRFGNLREATPGQNGANKHLLPTNTSGLKGTRYWPARRRWQGYIMFNRTQIHLGYFDTQEEAHAAYLAAADKYFGAFARDSVRPPASTLTMADLVRKHGAAA